MVCEVGYQNDYKKTGLFCIVRYQRDIEYGIDYSLPKSSTLNTAIGTRYSVVRIECFGDDGFDTLDKLYLQKGIQKSLDLQKSKSISIAGKLLLSDLPYIVNQSTWLNRGVLDIIVGHETMVDYSCITALQVTLSETIQI